MNSLPSARHALGIFPTPMQEMKRLASHLGGPRLFVKRDDLTGLALGGNKARKLEYLVAEALAAGCDTLVTGGAAQSNHCRQTAAAAAVCGLECHLALGGEAPEDPEGNLLLDLIYGAQIHWTGKSRKGEKIPGIVGQLERSGRKPFVIPYGGSNVTGVLGFVEAARELAGQEAEAGLSFSHVVVASSSGGTQAGLMLGKRLCRRDWQVTGIGIDKGESGALPFDEHILRLAGQTAMRLGEEGGFSRPDLILRNEYLGEGYGVVGGLERDAIRLAARMEGLLLDPVYTGRAMGALLDMIEKGEFSARDTVLFWHTGGSPALFPYARRLGFHAHRHAGLEAGSGAQSPG